MKFTVNSKDLQEKGYLVLKGLSKDVKSSVAFKVEDEKMTLLCYTSSTYFKAEIPVENVDLGNQSGEWKALDGQNLKTILSVLPPYDIPINFTSDKLGNMFTLRYNKQNKLSLSTRIGDMIKEETEFTELSKADEKSFLNTLSDVLKVVQQDANGIGGPTTCLHLFFNQKENDNNITFVGTDTIAIVEEKYAVDNITNISENNKAILLGINEAKLLVKRPEEGNIIKIVKTKSKFGFIDQENTITLVGITDENPISYEPIKSYVASPDSGEGYNKVLISAHSLKESIQNIMKLSPIEPSLTVKLAKEGMILETENGDRFEVSSNYKEDKELAFGLNKNALSNLFTIWSPYIYMTLSDEPSGQVLQFINTEGEENKEINTTFIGVMTDD